MFLINRLKGLLKHLKVLQNTAKKGNIKTCEIYKTSKNYIIITESSSDIGLGISDDPIYVIPINSTINELEEKVFDCLNSSRVGIYTPKRDEWASWQKEQLLKMGQKSFDLLYKNSSSCSLKLEDNILSICPRSLTRKHKGLVLVEKDIIKLDLNDINKDQAIKKIIEALSISYEW
jgi:hypothetical protein